MILVKIVMFFLYTENMWLESTNLFDTFKKFSSIWKVYLR